MMRVAYLTLAAAHASSSCQNLLQTSRSLQRSSPDFHYDAAKMWRLDEEDPWTVVRNETSCVLRYPAWMDAPVGTEPGESRFSTGRCLEVWHPLELWRLDLALPATHGRLYPGTNPALAALPEHLREAFPEGKWLVVSRAGWVRCPGMQEFQHEELLMMKNLWASGSYAAVLSSNFSVQAVAKIQMEGADWADAVSDARLWWSDGQLIVSFMAYYFLDIHHSLVARLHLSAGPGSLRAVIKRDEVRHLQSCRHPNEPKKNLGFLRAGDRVHTLDLIYPTSTSPLNLSELEGSLEPSLLLRHNITYRAHPPTTLANLCLEPHVEASSSPWQGCRRQALHPNGSSGVFFHNGPSPIWLEELQIYLGLGHLSRGRRKNGLLGDLPDHYSHQFFALSPAPFRLLAVSQEFCISSRQDPEDCENIQFASSLLLDGTQLLVGYGIEDCDAYVARFDLHEVIKTLVNLTA